jgi:hypothetical protein
MWVHAGLAASAAGTSERRTVSDLFMTPRWCALGTLAVWLFGCSNVRPPESPASALPLKRLRLYETGVGYFEREGTIREGMDSLPVPASHVDDALKTMVVRTNGAAGVTVSAIEFDSVLSRGLARSLTALPLGGTDGEEAVGYRDVLESLRGVEVVLALPNEEVRGKLVEVAAEERAPAPVDKEKSGARESSSLVPKENLFLTVVLRDGAVRRFDAARITSVRPVDEALAKRLDSAVSALFDRAAQMRRRLRVVGASTAPVRLGYIAETPVWRSTYRLELPSSGEHATIQGWALLHNDTDEPWSHVAVELVNGRPDSFLFPLSAPRYARRPLAEPPEELSTVPQLASKTADQMWGDHAEFGGEGIGLSGYGTGGGALGASHMTHAPMVRMGATAVSTRESDVIRIGDLAAIASARGAETGALFEYRLARALDLRPHGSALVPFTEQTLEARRLTWFAEPGEPGRSTARVVNTSAQTLPAGPVAIYEPSGFTGETGLRRLKPSERAFLQFGTDLDVDFGLRGEAVTERVERVLFANNQLMAHFVRHHERNYELHNRSASPRTLYAVLDIVKNAKISGADETDFDEDGNHPLVVFRIAGARRDTRVTTIDEGLERSTDVKSLTAEAVRNLVQEPAISERERSVLRSASVLLDGAAQNQKKRAGTEREISELDRDLERMRQHLQALGDKSGSPAGANPLVTRILELEDRLSKARRTVERLEEDQEKVLSAVATKLTELGAA